MKVTLPTRQFYEPLKKTLEKKLASNELTAFIVEINPIIYDFSGKPFYELEPDGSFRRDEQGNKIAQRITGVVPTPKQHYDFAHDRDSWLSGNNGIIENKQKKHYIVALDFEINSTGIHEYFSLELLAENYDMQQLKKNQSFSTISWKPEYERIIAPPDIVQARLEAHYELLWTPKGQPHPFEGQELEVTSKIATAEKTGNDELIEQFYQLLQQQ